MADVSAPYIIQSVGWRLESDEFILDFLYYNKASDGALTPKNVSDWVVKFTITNESDPTLNHIIANNSNLIDRTLNHRIRLRAKTPALAGLAIAVTGNLRPYRVRYSRIVAGDGAERTMRDIDVSIVKRIPEAANKLGPWLEESFMTAYSEETEEEVPLELKEALQLEILELKAQISALEANQTGIIETDLSEIESQAGGSLMKLFGWIQNSGQAQPVLYVPVANKLLGLVTYEIGGGPVVTDGPTISQRVATVETQLAGVTGLAIVTNYTALANLELPTADTFVVVSNEEVIDDATKPRGQYLLYTDGRILYCLTGELHRAATI